MEVKGVIKVISETVEVGAKGFKKRNVVVTTEDQYPQMISVEFIQDKCDLLDKYVVGDNVEIGINLRGREWINPEGDAVYFNTIQGWKIKKLDGATATATPDAQPKGDEPDDLPF